MKEKEDCIVHPKKPMTFYHYLAEGFWTNEETLKHKFAVNYETYNPSLCSCKTTIRHSYLDNSITVLHNKL